MLMTVSIRQIRLELRYAIFIGVGISIWVLFEYLLGFHTTRLEIGQYSGYLSVIIPILGLYLGLRKKRDVELKGEMSYLTALKSGVIISIIASLIIGIFFYFYTSFIHPSWIKQGLEFERKRMIEKRIPKKDIEKNVEQLKAFYSPQMQFTGTFIGTAIYAVLLTSIISLVVRRKKPESKLDIKKK